MCGMSGLSRIVIESDVLWVTVELNGDLGGEDLKEAFEQVLLPLKFQAELYCKLSTF